MIHCYYQDFVSDDPGTPETSFTHDFKTNSDSFTTFYRTKNLRNSLAANGEF